MDESGDRVEIGAVPRDQWPEALALVFSWEPEALRRQRIAMIVQTAQTDPRALGDLIEARRGDRRVAAAWGHVAPGRVATVWPSLIVPGEAETTRDLLQIALDQRLASLDVACAQSLLAPDVTSAAACLLRNGYSLAAHLLFLGCDNQQFPVHRPASELEFEPYRVAERSRLASLIEQTYVGTRDAPSLNGLRAVDDVIEGYCKTGNFAPERWFFVRHHNRDIGCLVLTEHASMGPWELIYMGLVPEARGHGWGSDIVQFAQWLAGTAAVNAIVLGVDESNDVAVATYARCGFREFDRRVVLVKSYT